MIRRQVIPRLPVITTIALFCAPGWGAEWLTDGGNPQRTAWQKDEKIFTTANVRNMKLLWKLKLDNESRQMHSLFPPLIVERVKAGLRNARAKGKRLGRPRVSVSLAKIQELRAEGLTLREIATRCHISKTSVIRALNS